MPALFRRNRRDEEDGYQGSSKRMAALIADLNTNASEMRAISHREFREFIRDRDRSHDLAWDPIRHAARTVRGR
jgi:hypothetical protein